MFTNIKFTYVPQCGGSLFFCGKNCCDNSVLPQVDLCVLETQNIKGHDDFR